MQINDFLDVLLMIEIIISIEMGPLCFASQRFGLLFLSDDEMLNR